jgi:hypothetical protein
MSSDAVGQQPDFGRVQGRHIVFCHNGSIMPIPRFLDFSDDSAKGSFIVASTPVLESLGNNVNDSSHHGQARTCRHFRFSGQTF